MTLDWITLRYSKPKLRDVPPTHHYAIAHPPLILQNGILRHAGLLEQCGRLYPRHEGLHLALPGTYWRRVQDGLNGAVQLHTLLSQHADACSLSRVDWATELPRSGDLLEQMERCVEILLALLDALLPNMHGWTRNDIRSSTGWTTYLGNRGRNADTMRERSPFLRVYHRFDSLPQVVRIELEWKHIPGETLADQYHYAEIMSAQLLQPFDLAHQHTDAFRSSDIGSRTASTGDQLWARIAGVAYGYALRRDFDAPAFRRALDELAHLMNAHASTIKRVHKKYLDPPAVPAVE